MGYKKHSDLTGDALHIPKIHAESHSITGSDPLTPAMIGAAPAEALTSKADLVNGLVPLEQLPAANGAIPTKLSDLEDDSTHRLVTDTEKAAWNTPIVIPTALADLADDSTHRLVTDAEKDAWNTPLAIPTALSDLTDDSTHRLVTDAEKATWNASGGGSAQRINDSLLISNGLVRRYRMNGSMNDSSGLGYHASLAAGTMYYMYDPFFGEMIGVFQQAGDTYFTGADTGLPSGASPWSICGWDKVIFNAVAHMQFFGYGTNGTGGKQASLGHFGGTTANALGIATGNYLSDGLYSTGIFTGYGAAWTHFAATYNGSSLLLYINGRLAATVNITMNIALTGSSIRIGASATTSYPLKGWLKDWRIYNRALSVEECLAIYEGA